MKPLGISLTEDGGADIRIWAPKADSVAFVPQNRKSGEAGAVTNGEVGAVTNGQTGSAAAAGRKAARPDETKLQRIDDAYFEAHLPRVSPGDRYQLRLDDMLIPDPFSRYQPEGVHGPSEVIDASDFTWHDADWQGIPQEELVFYELHVGTFSPEGTFEAARKRLPYLKDLGITAVELMPVADFPGRWNWGYDPGAFYAPSRAYGRPDDLRRLVDEAHDLGLAVFLDAVYNHLGPDGAYVAALGPLFTDRHDTPWGQAINLDDTHSEGVRSIFIDNACYWLREFHFDGFRLDATDALLDDSEPHFLAELTGAVDDIAAGPDRILVAEDHRNLNTVIQPRDEGGYGLDAVWVDDFHHLMRNLLAGDSEGYFASFTDSTVQDIAITLQQGWFYTGQTAASWGKPRGSDPADVVPKNCVYCIQNHDQVGNRPDGRRLTGDVTLPAYRAATALLLFAPQLPLLFQGQEWGASTPFQFFTDHADELGQKVSEGRRKEFEGFSGFEGDVPDPQDEETFKRSKLQWDEQKRAPHTGILALYRRLLALRRELPKRDGAFSVESHGRGGLVLQRGRHYLLVALEGDISLPSPPNAEVLLDTEMELYTDSDKAASPHADSRGAFYFPTPGALIIADR